MPTQELGAPAFRKYDIEAWMPGRESYGEVRIIVAVLNDVSNLDSSALDFICICIYLILPYLIQKCLMSSRNYKLEPNCKYKNMHTKSLHVY